LSPAVNVAPVPMIPYVVELPCGEPLANAPVPGASTPVVSGLMIQYAIYMIHIVNLYPNIYLACRTHNLPIFTFLANFALNSFHA
jgi:hypothetical protein